MMGASIDERQFSQSTIRSTRNSTRARQVGGHASGFGGDAFPRPRSGGASCFQSRLVLSAATTSRSPLLGSGGRSTRREVGGQVSRVHLEELHRLRQPAEAPGAKAPEADPVWERFDDRRAHGRRHDDLHRDGRFRIIRRERAPSTTRVRWPRLVHSERVARIDRHASFQAKGAAGGAAAECDSWRPRPGGLSIAAHLVA